MAGFSSKSLRGPPLADALSGLGYDAAKDLAGGLEEVTKRLREEYSRIFIGPRGTCPPSAPCTTKTKANC